MVKIVVSGICGRMGKRIASLAAQDKDFEIVAALESHESPCIGKDIGEIIRAGRAGCIILSDFDKVTDPCDALIEFTTPDATMAHLKTAIRKNVGMVIGTTAFSSHEADEIRDASNRIPIVFSPNMSVGANLLFKLTEDASNVLGKDYKIEIVEAHHTKKKDAPSGTAKRLGEAVAKSRGETPPIKSIREGDIVGDHTVIFRGEVETIELTHSAHSRDAFAKGALDAARFLKKKKTGLYSMRDVIRELSE